ncbi:ABC transporter ATP-binding protein [Kineococcus sp. SYSU DK003]|uniref:ABC transporter ATP-binding protein n=1 Tax=Kineococcus sp. SYSU DK003 TaxID=3383124 RepID=UPI003D7D0EB1
MPEAVLEVEDLVVEYGSGRTAFRAVDRVSFRVRRGTTLAVVGESGCGKSTVAKAVMRLLEPTGGRILLDGQDIAHLPERRLRPLRHRWQMVFQDPYGSLDPHLNAEEIVTEALRMRGRGSRADHATRVRELFDLVGLPASGLGRRPGEFSGGQRQRIGIARALASEPDLLLCDEATSALDVSVQAQVLELLRTVQRESGISCLFISHNLGVVQGISDDIVVMRRGGVVESGPTADVLTSPGQEYTRRLRRAALDPSVMQGRKPRHLVRQALSASA